MADQQPNYVATTEQKDIERRLLLEEAQTEARENGTPFVRPDAGTPRQFAVEGNELDGYVGTSPEYQTYADDTTKPLVGKGDRADTIIEEELRQAQAAVDVTGQAVDPEANESTEPVSES